MKKKSIRSWQEEIASSLSADHPSTISKINSAPLNPADFASVSIRYPMRITPYFFSLLQDLNGPLARQVLPDIRELTDTLPCEDPLLEEEQSPVPGLIHRYPDRVLFLVSSECAVYCRYCMRKRLTGDSFLINDQTRKAALEYIRQNRSIREVILSGGDPLLLSTDKLNDILNTLRQNDHIEIIRIHTRAPGVLPSRITRPLVDMLKRFHPLFINIQFNHPDEITPQSSVACLKLADAGIPLGSQTVLLKGINDNPEIMIRLMQKLVKIRIKPYYLHHPDLVRGTGHFRTKISAGIEIVRQMRNRVSGIGIPQYMIDLPGGGGKVPLVPDFVEEKKNGVLKVRGLHGRLFEYPTD